LAAPQHSWLGPISVRWMLIHMIGTTRATTVMLLAFGRERTTHDAM
jgi:hypothetical protein